MGRARPDFLPPHVSFASRMHKDGSENGAALVPCPEVLYQGLFFSPSSVISLVCGLGDAQARDGAGGRKISDPWLWKEAAKRK